MTHFHDVWEYKHIIGLSTNIFNIKRKQVPTFQMNTTRIWKCIKLKDNMFTQRIMCIKGGTCADKWMFYPLKNVKAFQHEIGSAVEHDMNHFKNYPDIIEMLVKFESLKLADEQCHGLSS